MKLTTWGEGGGGRIEQDGWCDRTAQNSSVLSPKPIHMAIKQ
jgi:hypothetical protein